MEEGIKNLRELAKKYMELAHSPEQEKKRKLWSRHNGLIFSRPLIYVRSVPYNEFFDMSVLKCTDPLLRSYEFELATKVMFHQYLNDDSIYEPWVTMRAVTEPDDMRWGVPCSMGERTVAGGAAAFKAVITEETDIENISVKKHYVNEDLTRQKMARLTDAFDGILNISVDRRGALCQMWNIDISTDLAKLRGLEAIMYDVYDRPEWLHMLIGKMQTAILKNIDETESAGDFSLMDHFNQAMPYAVQLEPPTFGVKSVMLKQLWGFMASQETTTFGPKFFDEFILSYQLPIMERFGLIAYGCCEDLTQKIPLLKRIKNLRRIAVSPFADLPKCAEQIAGDYVLSYRPNPSSMVSMGFDEDFVRRTLRSDFSTMTRNGCKFDITLKDVETVSGNPENLKKWVEIVRNEIDRIY